MVTIWGRANSSNVMKVLWLCEELGEAFDRRDVGGPFGGTREPAYLAMNPNSLVPTLQEADGFTLWESNAILRHLATTRPAGAAVYPAAPYRRAKADQWMDWQLGTLGRPMTQIFLTFIRTPEAERDLPAAAKARDEAERLWRIVDAELRGQDFICGDFSLADIALGIFAKRWFALPVERAELPELAAWYARLQSRDGFRRYVDHPLT
ncbi:glutathione S-transferase family protein [Roseomonas sp. BN140053]|uniref:glutathione S-transferase family protein n=1 Tax=Roseomonas sp. BN140053 TaxID=3391898 RepID=UPI0039E9ED51